MTAALFSPGEQDCRGLSLTPLSFSDLDGFGQDDHLAAFRVFLLSSAAIAANVLPLRKGVAASAALVALAHEALRQEIRDSLQPKRFFETHFRPFRVSVTRPVPSARGFLTGYYEPMVDGSLTRRRNFTAPVLARPSNLEFPGALSRPRRDRGGSH